MKKSKYNALNNVSENDPIFRVFNQAKPLPPKPQKNGSKVTRQQKRHKITHLNIYTMHLVMMRYHQEKFSELQAEIRKQTFDQFANDGVEVKGKPESFIAHEYLSEALCQLRKKGNNACLDEETLKKLEAQEIPYGKNVRLEEQLVINPDVTQEDLRTLASLIEAVPGLKEKNLIYTQGEQSISIVTEDTLDTLFKTKPLDIVKELISKVTTQAFSRFKVHGEHIADKGHKLTEKAKHTALEAMIKEDKKKPDNEKFYK